MSLSAKSNEAYRETQNDSAEESDSSVNNDSISDDIQDKNQISNNKSLIQNNSKKEPKASNKSNVNTYEINSESQNSSEDLSQNKLINKYEKIIKKIQKEGIQLSEQQKDKLRIYKEQNDASRVELLKLYSEFMMKNYNNQNFEEEEEEEVDEKDKETDKKNTEINNKNGKSKDKSKESKKKINEIKIRNKSEILEEEEEELPEEEKNESKLKNDKIDKGLNSKKKNSINNKKRSQYPDNSNDLQEDQKAMNKLPNSSKKPLTSKQSYHQNNSRNSKKKSSANSKTTKITKYINGVPVVDKIEVSSDAEVEEVGTTVPHTKLYKVQKVQYEYEYEEDQDELTEKTLSPKKMQTNNRNMTPQKNQKKQSTKTKQKRRRRKRINQSSKQQDNKEFQSKGNSKLRPKSVITRNTKSKLKYYDDDNYVPQKILQNKNPAKKSYIRYSSPLLLENNGRNNITHENVQNQLTLKKNYSEKIPRQSLNYDNRMINDQTIRGKSLKTANSNKIRSKSIDNRSNLESSNINESRKFKKANQKDLGLDYKIIAQHPEILDNEFSIDFFRSLKAKKDTTQKDENRVWSKKRFGAQPIPDLSDSYELSDEFTEEESDHFDYNDDYNEDDSFENGFDMDFLEDELPEVKKIKWAVDSRNILTPSQDISKVIRKLCIKYDTESLFPNRNDERK